MRPLTLLVVLISLGCGGGGPRAGDDCSSSIMSGDSSINTCSNGRQLYCCTARLSTCTAPNVWQDRGACP